MIKKIHTVILLLSCVALNYGCKKNPFDHRTKYLGDYEFTNSWSRWSMADSAIIYGTIYTTGKVEYGDEEQIRIILDSNYPTYYSDYSIDRDGNISLGNANIGKFQSKTQMYYSYTGGGLGSPVTSRISGKKK